MASVSRSAQLPISHNAYTVITGVGRSGTTWLMKLLDASPSTHCRSEPYGIPTSPFHRIPQIWKTGSSEPDIGRYWDEAMEWSNGHIGDKDHAIEHPKTFVRRFAHHTRLVRLMAHGKSRRFLSHFDRRFSGGEWTMPWWMGSQETMEAAYPVFKLNIDRRICSWLLENRPGCRVVHIVRHPCGRLHSWLNRFAAKRDIESISLANAERLRKICEAEQEWGNKFQDIDQLSFIESELWFWRYVNETIASAGNGRGGYLRIVYEDLAANPIEEAKRVYAFCGLQWEEAVDSAVRHAMKVSDRPLQPKTPQSIASRWRAGLAAEHIRTVERITQNSETMTWWPAANG